MAKQWINIVAAVFIAVIIGTVALNHDSTTSEQRVGLPNSHYHSEAKDIQTISSFEAEEFNWEDVKEAPRSLKEKEYLQQRFAKDLQGLNQEIESTKQELQKSFKKELSEMESPEVLLAQANAMTKELEAQGIVLDYEPVDFSSFSNSTIHKNREIQEVEKRVDDVEHRLRDLMSNQGGKL
ncbi:hypothetical protein [Vibrio sonorensis]|uniref:hypothetical protein n=1 Tax=Vibrio sonorensis TaxID=1004316 RepID=UPI0008D97D49|nr:hypothetical protein [Vibrio sonorensis]